MIRTDERRNLSNIEKESHDLIVYHYGIEECTPSHSYGPALRDHFLIHYILSGSGTFTVNGKAYKLEKGQGFLICPNIITYYEASHEDPWVYTWVGFKGLKAEAYLKLANLDSDNPIFTHEDDVIRNCFNEMLQSNKYKYGYDLKLQGHLSILLSELVEKLGSTVIQTDNFKDIYIKKTLMFIETNYSRSITIGDVAKHIGLNQNYFSSLFKESLDLSPQEYIIKYRINKACELLKNKDLLVSDIARSVGYDDPLGFSKIFRKLKGVSPRAYRENQSY